MKTIKQIADELGVSKTAVRKRMTPEVQTMFSKTDSGVIYISEEGEALIKSSFSRATPKTEFAGVSANQFADVSGEVSTLISMLQQELNTKTLLLEKQQSTISELTTALENTTVALREAQATAHAAQSLHAGTIQQQLTSAAADELSPAAVSVAPDETPGFFSRIFRRQKKNNDNEIRFD